MIFEKSEHLICEGTELRNGRNVKIGKFFCILNNKVYDTLVALKNAIKPKMLVKDYYDKYYKTAEESSPCVICEINSRSFKSLIEGYSNYCSSSCFNKSPEKRKKVSERFINNPENLKSFIEKNKQTRDSWSDEEKRINNRKTYNTLTEKYGKNYFSEKTKKQWEKRTTNEILLLVQKGNLTKSKNGTAQYNYFASANKSVLINNKLYFCQGYEDLILHFLLENMLFDSNDICVGKDVPRIKHNCLSGTYYPDIFVKSINLLIEVKSDFTFLKEKESNFTKQQSARDQSYNHVYFVPKPNNKRELTNKDVNLFKDFIDMTISSQALNEKVQRLSGDSEYTPIAIGSGCARALKSA